MHAAALGQLTFFLRILGREQMAARGVRTQHLARSGDFETFGDCLAGFAAGDGLGHEARNVAVERRVTNDFKITEPGY